MLSSPSHALLWRAKWISFALSVAFLVSVVATAFAPLQPWVRIPVDSVSTVTEPTESGSRVQLHYYLDQGGGARCAPVPDLDFDFEAQKAEFSIENTECILPARTLWGLLHEISAGLVLPALSFFAYFGHWLRQGREPRWRGVNALIGILSAAALMYGWLNYSAIHIEVVDGIAKDLSTATDFWSRMRGSTFAMGLGGLLSVLVTQTTELSVERIRSRIRGYESEYRAPIARRGK